VLDTDYYVNKIETMLSDCDTYSQNITINLENAKLETDTIIKNMHIKNYISNRQKRFLTNFTPKMPVFYGLPKIHKKDIPLRPIVSQIDSPSYKLNKYLDYLLTTAEKEIPYLLQDTTKFLQYLNNIQAINYCKPILFTIDVTSLYTVLPHEMCIKYVAEMYSETLDKWVNYTPDIKPIDVDSLKIIITTILNQTFFQFNNKTYGQKFGITMGAPSSVKLANITLYKHLQKLQASYRDSKPQHLYRLIDDVFGLWLDTKENLLKWFNYLNESHPSIKFTIDYSYTEIPFLDTLVYVEDNILKTKLYKKPTDKKQYLHYNSEHPAYMKNSIPFAQALRYRRVTTDNYILDEELKLLNEAFVSRGYPTNKVVEQINKVKLLKRDDTIQYKEKIIKDIKFTPFILTFSNIFNNNGKYNIYNTISYIWNELTAMVPILSNIKPPKIIFKKCTSISNFVECSTFPPKWWLPNINKNAIRPITVISEPKALKCSPCYGQKCQTCPILENTYTFHSTYYDRHFNIKSSCNCGTSDVIYLITCTKCHIQYVGETGQKFRDRMNNHKSTIRTKKLTPIAIHFNSLGHTSENLSATLLEKFNTNSILHRREREYYWQLRLGTIYPRGLNSYPINNTTLNTQYSLNPDNTLVNILCQLYDD